MDLKKFQPIFNALENEKRIELYEFILQNWFASKNELAERFSLNRANLNHHLEILIKAGIVLDIELMLDARKQTYLIPLVIIQPERLVKEEKKFLILRDQMQSWIKRNITLNTWKILRDELNDLDISSEIVDSIEGRLFPNLGKRVSKTDEYCYICHLSVVLCSCYNCNNLICSNHARKIQLNNTKEVMYCLNCVEKFFG